MRNGLAAAALIGTIAACSSTPTAQPVVTPSSSTMVPTTTPPASPTTARPAPPATYGGQSVSWPRYPETPAPPQLGAVETTSDVRTDVGTLAADLLLPRVGGTTNHPQVMTPCGYVRTIESGSTKFLPPASKNDPVVVLDPGHGGHDEGTHAPDGTAEKTRVLQIALAVRDALAGRIERVYLTRTRDMDVSLAYRTRLADSLGADLMVSVHLNANPDGPRNKPGTLTFGSIAQAQGRRAAGVIYQDERRYLDTLGPRVGNLWVGNRDAGAIYRRGQHGDYYYLLRKSHVPTVISESLYLTDEREARLVADPSVRSGLAHAIASGIVSFVLGSDPGSGWRVPIARPPDPPQPASDFTCADPA